MTEAGRGQTAGDGRGQAAGDGRGQAAGDGRGQTTGGGHTAGDGRRQAAGGGQTAGDRWKRHIVRQLKHRDLNQHDMFQDLICFCKEDKYQFNQFNQLNQSVTTQTILQYKSLQLNVRFTE